MMRAAYEVWGGEGWWRRNQEQASNCLRKIRWVVCDKAPIVPYQNIEVEARARWTSLAADETVLMFLFASRWLHTLHLARPSRVKKKEGSKLTSEVSQTAYEGLGGVNR